MMELFGVDLQVFLLVVFKGHIQQLMGLMVR